jgi:hypothetical protein
MPYVRKHTAGSSSHGYVWPEDGAVVEMPHEHAEELLVMPDGGFSLADGPSEPEPDNEDPELTEVIPDPDEPVTEPDPAEDETPAKAPARRGRKPAEG